MFESTKRTRREMHPRLFVPAKAVPNHLAPRYYPYNDPLHPPWQDMTLWDCCSVGVARGGNGVEGGRNPIELRAGKVTYEPLPLDSSTDLVQDARVTSLIKSRRIQLRENFYFSSRDIYIHT